MISDYEFLLSILSAFIVGTEKYYPKCNNVNDAKGLQILSHYCSIILRVEVASHKYGLVWLGLFKIRQTKSCVLSDLIKKISNYTYVLHLFNLKRVNKLFQNHTSQLKVKIARDVIKTAICWYGKKLSNYPKP